ncbi:hypothetical protein OG21DRAFT_1324058 [Imleria badia]|nr:hypothetical protein OG21DRAFT_1324058 [Imleria badia]
MSIDAHAATSMLAINRMQQVIKLGHQVFHRQLQRRHQINSSRHSKEPGSHASISQHIVPQEHPTHRLHRTLDHPPCHILGHVFDQDSYSNHSVSDQHSPEFTLATERHESYLVESFLNEECPDNDASSAKDE